MRTTKHKQSVIVGLFIFFAIVIIAAAILTLGGQKNAFRKRMTLNAVFPDVSGLQEGNNIWFAGVKAGTVKRIEFTGNSLVAVEMKIEKRFQPFISRDSKVKIGSDGLIGNRIILIYGGTPGTATIHAGDTLKAEMPLNSAQMMNTLQESNQNLSAITSNLKDVSTKMAEGEGTMGELFMKDSLSNRLIAISDILYYSSRNIQLLSHNLAGYTTAMQRKGVLANEIANDTILFSRLKSASLQIKEASVNAKLMMDNLAGVSYKLKDSSNLAGVVFQDQQAAQNFRTTVANLEAGTKKFDETMEALQHNFLVRGFFRKKAKREQQAQARTQAQSQSQSQSQVNAQAAKN
jgi:phospholipid/cholesterol/gamma-HCH transport system substrate-binding protein